MMSRSRVFAGACLVAVALTAGAVALGDGDTSSAPESLPKSETLQEGQAIYESMCEGKTDCALINTAANTRQASGLATFGEELSKSAIPASDCPEATAAYEAKGYEVGGFIGAGCPAPSSLDSIPERLPPPTAP